MSSPRTLAVALDARLAALGTPERAERERAYLKSLLPHHGTRVPEIRAEVRSVLRSDPDMDRTTLLELVESLWDLGVHEDRMAAAFVLAARVELLRTDDLDLVERFLREARTWAIVDTLAPAVAGPLVDAHPELEPRIDAWVDDPDFWMRRASLLRHLGPIRRGSEDLTAFAAKADRLLDDREFFVRKAMGWVLREAAKHDPEPVVAWLEPRVARISGVAFREALKPLPGSVADRLRTARAG
jgi:3-methyladenine DNA glycosylase AlkD